MIDSLQNTIRDAMRLMQGGDLAAATAAIQEGLGGTATPVPCSGAEAEAGLQAAPLDGEFRIVSERIIDAPVARSSNETRMRDAAPSAVAQFQTRSYSCPAGTRAYKLFIPGSYRGQPMPLIVMLHGCTQTPDDFARGTRMNELAEIEGCLVAYPAQAQSHNYSKCWNWFKSADQQRDAGEPAIIAGITRELLDEFGLDASRVYIAGLSAGAAMAVVMGRVYPDLYAAVGVHSGLPYAGAHDLPSAIAAMNRRATHGAGSTHACSPEGGRCAMIPTIVFHGDRDTTVSLFNGERVIVESVAGAALQRSHADVAPTAKVEVERGTATGGREFTRTIYCDDGDAVLAEQWVIHGSGHAWSGGDAGASYTDPSGPDASAEMLRFFSNYVVRANS